MNKYIVCCLLSATTLGSTYAENTIIIGKDTKVFETSVAKDEYAAVNQNDQPVILRQGMAFAIKEQKAGWYVIEYTLGLRGMVMHNVIADNALVKMPATGSYKVTNNPSETVIISTTGDNWTLKSGNKSYPGKSNNKTVLFTSPDGTVTYSLTNLSGKPTVYNYDNSITKFY